MAASQLRFDGRVALVTGGGRGQGREHCRLLAARGAKVVVNDLGVELAGGSPSTGPAQEVAAEIRKSGGQAVADTSNLSTPDGPGSVVRTALDAFGRLDIVVHNATVISFGFLSDLTYQQYRDVMAVNVDAGFLLAKAAWPKMMEQDHGRIIFVTSQAGLSGQAGLSHYAAAKTAFVGLARVLAHEGAAHGIQVNALSVTAFSRTMSAWFQENSPDPEKQKLRIAAREWWERYMPTNGPSQMVAWLAHDECDVSGQIVDATGSYAAHQYLAITEGYSKVGLTPEDIRDNRHRIFDRTPPGGVFETAVEFLRWQAVRIEAGGAPPLPTYWPFVPDEREGWTYKTK
jgi:NAD(P)-dependent dehydrogenase (short-subunit alcohol dehydrogenase family)